MLLQSGTQKKISPIIKIEEIIIKADNERRQEKNWEDIKDKDNDAWSKFSKYCVDVIGIKKRFGKLYTSGTSINSFSGLLASTRSQYFFKPILLWSVLYGEIHKSPCTLQFDLS